LEKSSLPSVSVVIPVRNEEKYIAKCLESLVHQDYPNDLLEIFVVDGASEDGSVEIIQKYSRAYPFVRLISNPRKVTPVALNLGIRSSDSDVVIILGAHSFVREDWVRKNVEALIRSGADCVGGPIESISESSTTEAISRAMSSPFGVGNALFRYCQEERFVDTVAFGAYKREVFQKIGYFDEELVRNQDDELNFRLVESGGKILLSPSIRSSYYTRSSLGKLWKQYYQYGFWKVRVIQKHKRPASIRHMVPAGFVLGTFLGAGLSMVHPLFLIATLVVWTLYIGLSIVFSFAALGKLPKKNVPVVMAAFWILHFSYGLGFLEGIVHFYIRKNGGSLERNIQSSR